MSEQERPDNYKVVYFGPLSSGKRTNLARINEVNGPQDSLAQGNGQNGGGQAPAASPGAPSGINAVETHTAMFGKPMSIATLAGALDTSPLWTGLLKGVDGVVFVADSTPERYAENLRAMSELIARLAELRLKIDNFPVVLQYNKRDQDGAIPVAKFEDELNPLGLPSFGAIATSGSGVIECARVMNHLISKLRAK